MINYILYRVGQFIALYLPLGIAYKFAVFISDLHYIFAFADRKAVTENLKTIFPQDSDREIRKMRIRVFRNFAKYLVDFFRFSKIDKEYIKKNIKIENLNYLDDSLLNGKGVIILTAHIGNWELGGVVVALLGYPFWVVALPHKSKKVDKFFNFQRESKGIKVIALGKAVRQSLNILKENKVLALAGDRAFSEKGAAVEFFGKTAIFPEGPAAFSIKTGAIILPGFMIRNEDDSFTLKFDEPVNYNGSDLTGLVKQCKIVIEDYIRKYPDQWYMFRRFWL